MPAQVPTVQSVRLMSLTSGGKSPVWSLKVDGAGQEGTRRHQHVPAAGPVAGRDGGGEGRGVLGGAVPLRAEPGDGEGARREPGAPDGGNDPVGGRSRETSLSSGVRGRITSDRVRGCGRA